MANVSYLVSVWLAARNHVATWPVGILGCVLFALLFFQNQLYADATLQVFFVVTSLLGWRHWFLHPRIGEDRVQRSRGWVLLICAAAALLVALMYGALLHRFTNAYAPWADSAVLSLSVVAQLLLMRRRVETWWFWLAVNTLAVPLFASRGLHLTALVYALFWFNAWYGWWNWRRLMLRDDA